MIISRTPFRISFFGGGTDYPAWFSENGGAVLATTINKYCYITCRYLPPFFDHKHRIAYSKIEHAKNTMDIQHPVFREILRFMQIEFGVEVHHDADLPARTGLGSSSSFTVGLIHALYALKGKMIDKKQLADLAVYIEQEIIKENVGCQDQFMASFGGLNLVSFNGKKNIHVQPLVIGNERLKELSGHLMLFFTGFTRISSEIAGEQIKNYSKKRRELNTMHQMVYEAISILNSNSRISEFGKLLHEGWLIKRSLSDKVSNYKLDDIYDAGIEAGAIGGKLLGAGGGGFMLLFVSPERQSDVRNRLKDLLCVPFQFENSGSTIIFYQPDQF
jgi:D-glycero-alpha-D-manno-heptose-7-phosphate kinase